MVLARELVLALARVQEQVSVLQEQEWVAQVSAWEPVPALEPVREPVDWWYRN